MSDGPTLPAEARPAPPPAKEASTPIDVKGGDGGSIGDHQSALDNAPQFGGALEGKLDAGKTPGDVIHDLGSENPAGDTQTALPMSGAERAGFGPVQQPRQLDQLQPGSGADRAGFGPDQATPAVETPTEGFSTTGATGNEEQKFNVAGANPDMAAAVAKANGQDPEAARQRAEDENAQAQKVANEGAEDTSATEPEGTTPEDAQADTVDTTTTPDSDTTDNEKKRYFTGIRTKASSIRTRYLEKKAVRAENRAVRAEDKAEVKRAKADKAQEVVAGRTPVQEATDPISPTTETQTPPSTPEGTALTPDAEVKAPEKPVDSGKESNADTETDAKSELSPEAAERLKLMDIGEELKGLGITSQDVKNAVAENPAFMETVRENANIFRELSKTLKPEAAAAAANAAADSYNDELASAEASGNQEEVKRIRSKMSLLKALGIALLAVGALAVGAPVVGTITGARTASTMGRGQ